MYRIARILLAAVLLCVGAASALAQQQTSDEYDDPGFVSIFLFHAAVAASNQGAKAPTAAPPITSDARCKEARAELSKLNAMLPDAREKRAKAAEDLHAATIGYRKAQDAYDDDRHATDSPERTELRRKLGLAEARFESASRVDSIAYQHLDSLQADIKVLVDELANPAAHCDAAAATPPKQPPSPSPKPAATPKPVAPRKVMTFPIPVGFFKVTRTYRERWDEKDNHLYDEVQVPNTVGKWVMWAYPEERRGSDLIGGRQVATVVAVDQNGGTLVATFDAASVMGPYKTNTEFCPVVQDLFKRGQLVLSPLNKKYTEVLLEPCQ